MDLEVRDKVTFVTGGSKGIGLACARAFLLEGARVAIASRNAENREAARRSLNAGSQLLFLVAADLVRSENAKACCVEFKPISAQQTSSSIRRGRTAFSA